MWKVNILTLFPEMFPGIFDYSIAKQARLKKIWDLKTINIRDFAVDKYKRVDDKDFGGGAGLVLKADVLGRAIDSCYTPSLLSPSSSQSSSLQSSLPPSNNRLIYLTPKGSLFKQETAYELIKDEEVTIICGRYEGIDERIITRYNPTLISIGDFILSGGELAAFTILDACIRLLPEVIKLEVSKNETFALDGDFQGLLEYPHYTHPRVWHDMTVPEILLSGDHEKIRQWRIMQAKTNTQVCRADLWDKYLNLHATNAKSKIKGE